MIAVSARVGLLWGNGHHSRCANDEREGDGDKRESSFHGAYPLKKVTQGDNTVQAVVSSINSCITSLGAAGRAWPPLVPWQEH